MLALLILALTYLFDMPRQGEILTYSDVLDYFRDGKVQAYDVDGNDLRIQLNDNTIVKYEIPYLSMFVEDVKDIEASREEQGLETVSDYDIRAPKETPWWVSFVPYLVLFGIVIILWYFMMRQAGGGGKAMSFGKARTRVQTDNKKRVTFADVAGADEEKEELSEIVDFLREPRKYTDIGARVPKGVLLVGPPGTGKTYLAKAVAGEAGVPFLSISGSDFVEMYVGVGASRVRDLFDQAKKNQPAIIFIDEIDAVGRQRGAGLGGGHDEREQTLNQLLVEMDGFASNEGVIVIAATNRPDILDTALLRPGRFDRQIYIGLPDQKAREEILKIHARGKQIGPDIDFSVVARSTAGFSPADLENLLNEAALLSARAKQRQISMEVLSEAIIKVIAGPEKKSRVISDKERKLTAYHEAGHAVVTRFLPTQPPVHQISIIPRGTAGGYTLSLPYEDKSFATRSEMLEDIVSLLGGRVSEKLFLDDISTGASNDISRATKTARKMVMKYGMSDELGPITFGSDHDEVFIGRDFGTMRNYSEEVAGKIDREIRAIVENAFQKASEILAEKSDKVRQVAEYLLAHEKMEAEDFNALFGEGEGTAAVVSMDKLAAQEHSKQEEKPASPEEPSETPGAAD
ncbi:MAG: ATP-dependent zinc metalloprotease FtsH [Eubacteriales bacterium]|nr:ATP-dependent zinc metalloprotease FtsH [Eubacteriales bacterium]MDY5346148.1 ATP-dependent zinc metalloprotease FtsH [Eubacteriales bacterium]